MNPRTSSFKGRHSPLFELACVLVRFDHGAGFIVNANYSIVRTATELRVVDRMADRPPDCEDGSSEPPTRLRSIVPTSLLSERSMRVLGSADHSEADRTLDR